MPKRGSISKWMPAVWVVCLIAGCSEKKKTPQANDNATSSEPNRQSASAAREPPDPEVVFKIPLGDAPSRGRDEAVMTAVAFLDFTDPASAALFKSLHGFQKGHPDTVRWVFRHFPRIPEPPGAFAAAQTACHAQDQGKFEPFALGLFERVTDLGRDRIVAVAKQVGVEAGDGVRAKEDPCKQRVIRDRSLAVRMGIRRAPALFVNGRLRTVQNEGDLARILKEETARARELLQGGVVPAGLYAHFVRHGKASAWMQDGQLGRRLPKLDPAGGGKTHPPERVRLEPGHGPSLGPRDAPVQLVMFADLSCQFCSPMVPRLRELQGMFPTDLCISLWQVAALRRADLREAELMILASAGQGTAWKFVEKVYKNSDSLQTARMLAWAKEVGLDVARMKRGLDRPEVLEKQLEANRKAADRAGARGRPYLFVQGRRVKGATSLGALKRIVSEELEPKGAQ